MILLSLLCADAGAQTYFTTSGFGDLIAGFRKNGAAPENNELVVNLGNITNLLKLAIGATTNFSNYSKVQITNMCPDNLANLQWSVFSAFQRRGGISESPWVTPAGTIPPETIWQTLPRTDVNTKSTSPNRYSYNGQGNLRQRVLSVGTGAAQISQALNTTNQFNNSLLVTEPVSFDSGQNTISYLISDPTDATIGNFGGFTFNIENTTPDPFDSPARSDLYQFCPTSFVDPFSGLTNGAAYYVGYFTLNTDGTMSFTRDTSTNSIPNPPPPPVLSISTAISQGGGGPQVDSTISFSTTNGATYTLYYTNASGLTAPVTNWPSITTPIAGDGLMHSFTNSSTDLNRFYSIGAH